MIEELVLLEARMKEEQDIVEPYLSKLKKDGWMCEVDVENGRRRGQLS